MQNISVDYQNEKGDSIERLPINFVNVLIHLYDKDFELIKNKYPWTTTIDPYGNTTFNLLQWPYLIKEFNEIQKEIDDQKAKNVLSDLVFFIKKIENENHTYLKFIGD